LATIVSELQRVRILCTLPPHYVRHQIQALQQRYGISNPNEIPQECIDFVYCPACEKVYSLVRDFGPACASNYAYGLRDAATELSTGKTYCSRKPKGGGGEGLFNNNNNNISTMKWRGDCRKQELRRIPLLGRLVKFVNKRILLCCQPGCGMAMVLDTAHCAYNEYGPACFDCTFKIKQAREARFGLEYYSTTCLLCVTELKRPESTFLYPYGVALCQSHQRVYGARLAEHLKTPEVMLACVDKKSTSDAIVSFVKNAKREHAEKQQSYNKFALQVSKARSRTNVRR
jgi:hypothetical protein